MYQALYRKWRPKTFSDVIGQSHITETLQKQVAEGRTSHAYLFTGTRGTGKTTCAKILARAVTCRLPENGNPCNQCPACLGIETGTICDVLELDAASTNGVDQVRALRDAAVYTPAAVRKRVYIVDEVHMLSTPAFNALLKILEEPPAHLMFILATTELHKVPATIKSRCQQFAFKRISPKAIADRLAYVAEQEGLTLTAPAAALLARLADGGLRDGLSLLDQCSGGGGEITEETVLSVLGLAGSRRTAQILDSVSRRDTAGALQGLDELYRDGKDMGALLGELSSLVRDLLIRKTAPEGGQGLLTGGYEEKTLRALAEGFTAAELVQMMGILQKAQADLYRSSSRRLDAELCLIRLCDRHLAEDVEGLTARISRLEEQLACGVPAAPAAQPAQPVRGPEPPAPVSEEPPPPWEEEPPPLVDQDLPPCDVEPAPPAAPVRPAPPKPQPQTSPAPAQSSPPPAQGNSWSGFLAGLKDLPPMAQSFLRKPDTVTGVFDETSLTLWVDSDLTKGVLSRGDTLKRLEQAAEGYTGQPHRVFVKVGKPQPPEPSAPAEDKFNDLLALGRQFGNFTVK